jgi:ketosteroid isomerase-like protein
MTTLLLIPFLILLSQLSIAAQKIPQRNLLKGKEELMQADIDFSNLSKEKGMNHAFLEYVADNGVMLRPYTYPIVGKETITKNISENDDKNLTLTWAPLYADIAESGELGYTYGIWEMHVKKEDGTEDIRKGTYVTIWKKDKSGKWKFTLDTGNQGLEPKK